MRLVNITMTEELAQKIDNLLKMATTSNNQVCAPVTNDDELNEYIAIGEILEPMGYAKRLTGNLFHITPAGMYFVKTGGFTSMYWEKRNEEEKKKEEEANKKKDEKIKLWLSIWAGVATLVSLLLAFLK